MRQNPSCTSWEPARRSTLSRSHSSKDSSETKVASYQTIPKSNQQHQQISSEHGYTFAALQDNLRALPSRPKHNGGPQYNRQPYGAGEENKSYAVATSESEGGYVRPSLVRPTSAIEVNVARSRCHPRRRPCSDIASAPTPKLRRDTDRTEAVVRLIVFFSTKLVHTIWSQASDTPKTSKDFNGAGVLPLQVFIQETLRRSKTSYSTLQVALFYLILLRPHVKPCQAAQQQYTPGCRALQCGRRMFLTALILASKYLQDRNYSARAWSKISGLPVAEINENERHYLELIKYSLHMTKDTFENWSKVVFTICKASGQGPFSRKPDSPPSSPDGMTGVAESEQPGSSSWWSYHLSRLGPEMVKNSGATDEYLTGLASGAQLVDSTLSLDTPPSSPETLEDILSEHSSPLVIPSPGLVQANGCVDNTSFSLNQSPAPVRTVPSRPLPPNLPTPQTTPRYDSASMYCQKPSQPDLRCRASLQAMANVDKHAINMANLETCPPPRPRACDGAGTGVSHSVRDVGEYATVPWMSSPESTYSDSSSTTTRSRSSSISSVSSVWSMPGPNTRHKDEKPVLPSRAEHRTSCLARQAQDHPNIGTYSFYNHVGNAHPITGSAKPRGQSTNMSNKQTLQKLCASRPRFCKSVSNPGDLSESQIAHLLASLSSQSNDHVQGRVDPAAINEASASAISQASTESCKKHKRTRSSKEENILHDEVRQFLCDEQVNICVKDDTKPTTYVEASDKQAQYPLQQWAHAKKPVPNALHTKRIALQHSSSPQQRHASELAADFLRQSVSVL